MAIKILVADDHQIFREGLIALLSDESDFTVVANVSGGREAVKLAKELSPDIALLDINMPELNGLDAARQIASDAPDVRVIGLSMHSERHFVSEMFKAGAVGYLLKMCDFEELSRAIREVAAGNTYVSPGIAGVVMDDYRRNLQKNNSPEHLDLLSGREREVLQLLAEGKGAKEIALILHVSTKTIETHRRTIMQKLELDSLAELTKYAIRAGLTTL